MGDKAVPQAAALEQVAALVRLRTLGHRCSRTVAAAAELLTEPLVWSGPDDVIPHPAPVSLALQPRLRVVVDEILTAAEVRYFAREALNRSGKPLLDDSDDSDNSDDEQVKRKWSSWAEHPLNERTVRLVCDQIRRHFEETRPLYLAGALLRRMTGKEGPPHVDKSNIGHYDYSATVYLGTVGVDFDGGHFAFIDASTNEVIEPRAGRCLLFASGTENLHQVSAVRRGARVALGLWFTLTSERGKCFGGGSQSSSKHRDAVGTAQGDPVLPLCEAVDPR